MAELKHYLTFDWIFRWVILPIIIGFIVGFIGAISKLCKTK